MEIQKNRQKQCYFIQYLCKRISEIHNEVLEHENSQPKCESCAGETSEISYIKNQLFLIVSINFEPKDEIISVEEVEDDVGSEPFHSRSNSYDEESFDITKEESLVSSVDSRGYSYPSLSSVLEKQPDEPQPKRIMTRNCMKKRNKEENVLERNITEGNIILAEKLTISTKDYQCEYCEKIFIQKSSLILHMKTHIKGYTETEYGQESIFPEGNKRNKSVQKCAFCHRTYKRKHSCRLVEPKVRTTFECAYCPEIFSIYPKIHQHHKAHHPDKPKPISPYQCEICGAFALRIYALKRHMATHTDYAPFKCDVCQKKFRTRQHLEEHKRKHIPKAERDDKYKCDICQKKFTFRQSLVKHKNHQHTNNRTLYPCTFCGGNFISEISLQKHQAIHEGEAPRAHKCDQCGRIFDKLKYLNHHRKVQHNIFTDLMLKPKNKKK